MCLLDCEGESSQSIPEVEKIERVKSKRLTGQSVPFTKTWPTFLSLYVQTPCHRTATDADRDEDPYSTNPSRARRTTTNDNYTTACPISGEHQMGAEDAVIMDREVGAKDAMEGKGGDRQEEKEVREKDGEEVVVVVAPPQPEIRMSRLQTQAPVTPIQVAPHSPSTQTRSASPIHQPQFTPMQSASTLNSRAYTNRISLCLFLIHLVAATAAICFFIYKAVEGILDGRKWRKEKRLLSLWLPPVEGSALLSIVLAFAWQKAVRVWPSFMIRFILWTCFGTSMAAGILLLCFSMPNADGLAVALIAFSIGNGLYACWVTRRTAFAARVLTKSLLPATKFGDLNKPTYLMLAIVFVWISLWCFAVIGALNFYYPPLTIIALVLSLAWTVEVMRNVANLTVSRVVALYYLRGMQSDTEFCFQRAATRNLGSACLGSLFVPTIEACRIIARGLNLLEGEDEFMFSCAHCCLRVMETIFRYGNSWAFVHIAAYGKGFVAASQSTWDLFERQEMEPVVDADMTSSICFLTGVTSGSICVIFAASWTFASHKPYTATVSLLAFFVGYLMTRIGMALPQACVACYYVCYAENPGNRLFDSTIPDRINLIRSGGDVVAPTPRFRRRTTAT